MLLQYYLFLRLATGLRACSRTRAAWRCTSRRRSARWSRSSCGTTARTSRCSRGTSRTPRARTGRSRPGRPPRLKGWLIPAYPMPDDLADLTVQRIVVRNGLMHDLATKLLGDIKDDVAFLQKLDGPDAA